MKKKTARVLCFMLALLMILMLLLPYVVRATAREDMEKLGQQLEDVKERGKELEQQEAQQQQYKENLQQQNTILRQQIELLSQTIDQTKADLAQKQAQLDAKRREIEQTDALFKERLRAMQVNHTSGMLSTLLAVNSFDELLTASTTLSRISVADTELLARMAAERAELERQEAEIAAQLDQLNADMELQQQKQAELAGNLQKVDKTLSDLEAQQLANAEEEERLAKQYEAARQAAIAEMQKPSSIGEFVGGSYGWPVPNFYYISSPYGWRILLGRQDFHTGIDISGGNIYGNKVVASLPGVVQTVVYGQSGYGLYVIIDHGGNNKTLYGHMSAIYVTPGQAVMQGDAIGAVGSTGFSTGPHLHFEIRTDGRQVDPAPYLGR